MFAFGLNSKKWVKKFQKTEKETKNYNKLLYNTWKRIITDYELDFKKFLESIQEKEAEYENSLIFLEMVGFTKRFANVQNLVCWGFYHSALLELRFMLETTILAYYLDQQLPKTKKDEKLKLMQKHKGELWGDRLRRRAYMYDKPFGQEVTQVINEINKSIDEYMTDLSPEDWREPAIAFSERDFNDCVYHSKNVAVLIIRHFTKSFEEFKYYGELLVKHKVQQTESKEVLEKELDVETKITSTGVEEKEEKDEATAPTSPEEKET